MFEYNDNVPVRINNKNSQRKTKEIEGEDYIMDGLVKPKFKRSKTVKSSLVDAVNIGFIVINQETASAFSEDFVVTFSRYLVSILTYSSGTPLHFIVITNKISISGASKMILNILGRYVSEGAILRRSWRWRRIKGLPRIQISFVDCNEIVSRERPFFNAMKRNSQQENSSTGSYAQDLFYIAPIYHRVFVNLNKIIFLDSKDLEFFSDIKLLYDQFNLMGDTIIGVSPELTPHYQTILPQHLLIKSDSTKRVPSIKQGLNTGVVLYRLDKMRNSTLYNWYVTQEGVDFLMKKFGYKMTVGDQDWMNNLSFSHPTLFYSLPCQFNRQTSIDYMRPPWIESFPKYHFCDKPSNIKIFHRNGCGPTPKFCGYHFPSKDSQLFDINIDVEQLWISLRDLNERPKSHLKKFSLLLRDILIPKCMFSALEYCMQVFQEEISIDF